MPRTTVAPTLAISLTWDQVSKRWRLDWMVRVSERAVASHWLWVECQEPMDALNARRLVDALRTEMNSWLPFWGLELEGEA